MTNTEINKYIHEQIMGNTCWHAFTERGLADWRCRFCEMPMRGQPYMQGPEYTSDDSPRRLLNEALAVLVAAPDWETKVKRIQIEVAGMTGTQYAGLMIGMSLTAEQLARIIVAAHKSHTEAQQC